MDFSSHKETIKSLNPLFQSKYIYKTETWNKLPTKYKDFVVYSDDDVICRQDIITSFENYYSNKTTWETPFLLTMIWGFGDTGYGTFRTNNYISNLDNHQLIIDAFEFVKKNNLELAFQKLKSIKGLNISYISKILYFATKACKLENYALIYDIRVAKSLIKLNVSPELFEIVEVVPSTKFKHYELYNSLIHKSAKELNVSAESIEMFLFDQKF